MTKPIPGRCPNCKWFAICAVRLEINDVVNNRLDGEAGARLAIYALLPDICGKAEIEPKDVTNHSG